MSQSSKETRDTSVDKVKKIYALLRKKKGPIYKSDLKEVGFDPKTAQKWIDVIQYIQSETKLIVKQAGRYTTIELEDSDS